MTEQPQRDEETLALASVFPAASTDQWRDQLTKVLERSGRKINNAALPEESIQTVIDGGIVLDVLYVPDSTDGQTEQPLPGFDPFTRGATTLGAVANGWDVRQLHSDPDPKRTNKMILDDLENGVSSIWLLVGDQGIAVHDLAQVLDGVELDLIDIVIQAADSAAQPETIIRDATAEIAKVALTTGTDLDQIALHAGLDPLSAVAGTGAAADLSTLAATTATINEQFPKATSITVDSTTYFNAGSTSIQELAFSIATGITYLRTLVESGLTIDEALRQIEFRYAIDDDQFTGIAKLRAARNLWGQIVQHCGASTQSHEQTQHAVTAKTMFTKYDPWVNMLRGTIACFAAATGGASAITVLPFDTRAGLPDSFARRVARNTQSVLHDESNIGRVVDPAGGSTYVEELTTKLAAAAWELFQQLEANGGMAAAIESGFVTEQIDQARLNREVLIATRKEPITGVSEFPNLNETLLDRETEPASINQETTNSATAPTNTLRSHFRAEAFEEFRDKSNRILTESGSRPKVFMATLGPIAAHTARENFATNLLTAGGVETVKGPIDTDVAATAQAFKLIDTPVACLAASDQLYSAAGDELIQALRNAGATTILLAGKTHRIPELHEPVDIELFLGCDAIEILENIYAKLGVHND